MHPKRRAPISAATTCSAASRVRALPGGRRRHPAPKGALLASTREGGRPVSTASRPPSSPEFASGPSPLPPRGADSLRRIGPGLNATVGTRAPFIGPLAVVATLPPTRASLPAWGPRRAGMWEGRRLRTGCLPPSACGPGLAEDAPERRCSVACSGFPVGFYGRTVNVATSGRIATRRRSGQAACRVPRHPFRPPHYGILQTSPARADRRPLVASAGARGTRRYGHR